jgi:glutamyl-tRNA reductase
MLTQAQVATLRGHLDDDERLLLIDLAMPPNLDPGARAIHGVDLHGIEEMRDEAERNRQLRMAEMDRCEKLVDHQLETLRRHLLDRELSPAAQRLRASFQEVADRAVAHALTRKLSHLSEDDREEIDRLARGLVKRLVQVPLRGLKGAAWNHSSAVIDGFMAGLDGDPADREPEPS